MMTEMKKLDGISSKLILIDSGLISLMFFDELCLNGSLIYIVSALLILRLAYVYNYRVINFPKIGLWILGMLGLTTIIGLKLNGNEQYFSFQYNTLVFFNVILVGIILFYYKKEIVWRLIKNVSCITTIVCGSFIFLSEYSEISARWIDFLRGTTGYRLGISSNINPNSIAWLFGFQSIVLFFVIVKEKKYKLIIIYFLQLLLIFFTGSKNGLIMIFIPIVYVGIIYLGQFKFKQVIILLIMIILLIFLVNRIPFLYTLIGKRFEQFFSILGFGTSSHTISDDGSTILRLEMINKGLNMFFDKPILGWGIGGFAIYSGFGYYSHNNYIEALVSGGLVTFVVYYYQYFILLSKSFLVKNSFDKMLCIVIIITMLFLDFGAITFYNQTVTYYKILIVARLVSTK